MRALQSFATIGIIILCAGCLAATSRERAVAIATGDLAGRKLPLPEDYIVHVDERVAVSQIEPAEYFWKVEFRRPGRGEPLYTATVDQRRGTVQDFTDHRREKTLAPSR
jgi:hypothetical protein